MTRQQTTVIWLGLVLVIFNVIIHLTELKSVLFGTPSTAKTTPAGNPVIPAQPAATPNATPSNVTVT